ncbi:MAG: phosphopyruvate hydratase [Rubellimicrobium sp.]|nr:phosphopyruvate hydratase [Rubellimicrobium sp.]
MTTLIETIRAARVWDSRGRPTVEAEVRLSGGATGRAIAPAGASRGSREAVDLRDGGERLGGMGVTRALKAVDEVIAPLLAGRDAADQAGCDAAMRAADGTATLSHLGGNAVVAVSLALSHAVAAARGMPLWAHLADVTGREALVPLPEIQIFGGGAHAGRRIDIQDLMVMVPGADSLDEALEVTAEIYRAGGAIMEAKGRLHGVADEGGWWPDFASNEEALETLCEAIHKAGEVPGGRVVLSLDIAASEFGKDGRYRLALDDHEMAGAEFATLLSRWCRDYHIAAIEDPLAEDDRTGTIAFTRAEGDRLQIIGDDYLVTDAALIKAAVRDGACNAALIKVNQNGTLSGALEAEQAAHAAGWGRIVSARSGESEDVSIVHIATGLGTGQLKVGSIARSERGAKWNECLRIARDGVAYAGGRALGNTWWGKA